MKIYLAARYGRREEMQCMASLLLAMGHEVTSRWLCGDHQAADNEVDCPEPAKACHFALDDYFDIDQAQLVISFTESIRTPSRGGRHVEFGLGLAMGKRMWIVGPREHVFHCLAKVIHFTTLEKMLAYLAPETKHGQAIVDLFLAGSYKPTAA